MKSKTLSGSERTLSRHILPMSGSMIGICITLIGLIKILERQGPTSYADEFAAAVTLIFLVSAGLSYVAIRNPENPGLGVRCELIADRLFVLGLVAVSAVAVFFAYEVI